MGTQGVQTWETDDNKLIQTVTSTSPDGSNKTTTVTTALYELSDGNNMMIGINPQTGEEIELEFPCVVLLRSSAQDLLNEQADWLNLGEPVPSYQSSKPSWC